MQEIPAPPGKNYLPYQLKGIRYALGGRGTLIADEMGLGKTVQAIGVINAISNGRNDITVVIVCPAFLRLNWHEELDRWMVNSCKVSVVSYNKIGLLSEDTCDSYIDILIIDEAHYIKNPESNRAIQLETIAKRAKRVIALTGTPMENRPIELWQILKIVCPDKWTESMDSRGYMLSPDRKKSHPGEGPAFWAFAERYCDLKYSYYQTRFGRRKALDFSGASNLSELGQKLRATCMVRRLKKDVLTELPRKRRQLVILPSDANDSDLLPHMSEENYEEVVERMKVERIAFEDWSRRRHEQALAKVDQCLRFIGDVLDETRKLIIFAHHTDVIEKLGSGIGCELGGNEFSVTVTGEVSMKARDIAVKEFQENPLCRVIIGSIGAMGVGLTLTAADHVIFVELDPVPGRLSQAEDRAHRIGQRKSVLVQHLVAQGSLCARMAQIVVKKQAVIEEGLGDV